MLQAGGPRARHETGPDVYWPPSTGAPLIYIQYRWNGSNLLPGGERLVSRGGVSPGVPEVTSDNKYYVNLLPSMWIDRSGPVPRRVR